MTLETEVTHNITIKRLDTSPKTLETVANLVNACYRSDKCWTNESNIVAGLRTTPSQLLRDSQSYEIYIARREDDVIGCIKTGKVESSVLGKLPYPAGYIGLLAVDPEHQSKGVASTLIRFAERRCLEIGLDVMVMDVLSPRVDIMQWYIRLGYRPTGESTDAQGVIEGGGETLLTPASFLLLQKRLR